MQRVYIKELVEGRKVSGCFLIKDKQLLPYKNKPGKFLHLVLADRTGEIEACMWQAAEETFLRLTGKNVALVEGNVGIYRDSLQITIHSAVPCEDYDVKELLPMTPHDLNQLKKELQEYICSLKNADLRDLLSAIFSDQVTAARFFRAPAAKMHHQPYLGGLLEHTLGVVKACEALGNVYTCLDRDLLITGAVLHDIGKIEELTYSEDIDYSDEGRLLGHIVLGLSLVERYIDSRENFSPDLKLKVLHMIASHHGEYEWQSPKRPKFLEAYILHFADMLDAQVYKFLQAKEEPGKNENWSTWLKGLDRYVYLKV